MHFNENKSKVLVVTKKTSGDNRTLNIYLNNKCLEQVSELKYLGIYFDSRFISFDRHVDYITGKCTPIINVGKISQTQMGYRAPSTEGHL